MGEYCKELRILWVFRQATGAPYEAYAHDIMALQAYMFDQNGNNVMKATLSEACSRLLNQIREYKCKSVKK